MTPQQISIIKKLKKAFPKLEFTINEKRSFNGEGYNLITPFIEGQSLSLRGSIELYENGKIINYSHTKPDLILTIEDLIRLIKMKTKFLNFR